MVRACMGIKGMDGVDYARVETVPITITVSNARPVTSKALFALVDVEVRIAGVAFHILGIQARREPDAMTSIRLPTFKDASGTWRPAIQLPNELREPLADAVLAFLVEEGLARHRFR